MMPTDWQIKYYDKRGDVCAFLDSLGPDAYKATILITIEQASRVVYQVFYRESWFIKEPSC
jgi:hypothetical protein